MMVVGLFYLIGSGDLAMLGMVCLVVAICLVTVIVWADVYEMIRKLL